MNAMMICIGLGLIGWALLLLAAMALVAVICPIGTSVVVGVPILTTIIGMVWIERQAVADPEE